jgi:hypothetical protein
MSNPHNPCELVVGRRYPWIWNHGAILSHDPSNCTPGVPGLESSVSDG